ncbi:MAG: hypothetical protein D9N14_10035 [Ketobacter sp.]|nr:MAG: hypothetical protein D9N14_10035 [Ketobacter sp.]
MMFSKSPYLLMLLCLLLALPGQVAAGFRDPLSVELPELEVIEGAQWYWAGRRMAVNNVPMSIKLFSFPGTQEQVKAFYLGLWKTRGHGKLTQKAIGDMSILGYQLDGFQYSVQFSQQGEVVDGKIVVTPTPLNYEERRKTSLPLPPRSRISSVVESIESGQRSESVTFESSLDVPQVLDFYLTQLKNDQWVQYSGSGDGYGGAVVSFQRGGELLQLNIKGLQGANSTFSQVLINWVK